MTHTTTPSRRWLGIATTALAGLVLLAGCSGGRHADSGSAGGAEPANVPTAANQDRKSGSGGEERDEQGATGTTGTSGAAKSDQLLTYTASLRVRVDDTTAKTTAAEGIVTKAGGYVENQNQSSEDAESAYATTTFRVPSAKYRTVLDQLGKLGRRTNLTQQTENVTQQVADVDARIKSANTSLARLRTLLKDASDVKSLIYIESEISRREADLESLQAQQRALDKQVRYATVTLTLTGKTELTTDERETGFLAGLRAGWNGFVGFLTGVATVVGAVLPFLIVVAPLSLAGYLLWRRLRRRPQRPSDSNPSDSGPANSGPAPAPATPSP